LGGNWLLKLTAVVTEPPATGGKIVVTASEKDLAAVDRCIVSDRVSPTLAARQSR
jgi:hypothetical protein